ncbi:MAG: trypsin-like peptidase domain-containing protein [Planctomycetes bacterium]|nr:trypsin-like peptidase domain-containing protein [Planctomycetota bacterium]
MQPRVTSLVARALVGGLLVASSLPAMQQPTGVIAIAATKKEQEACNGSAVLISADGQAITLLEALPGEPKPGDKVEVIAAGLRRQAEVVRRGAITTAVLLRIEGLPSSGCTPIVLGDSRSLVVGAEAWTAGNVTGAIEQDGLAALSRGVVSGLYDLPADAAPVRGRMGRILSTYRGPVIETDAGINDGSQGGALLDGDGRCMGLISLGQARERRLGTAIPMHVIASDLALERPLVSSTEPRTEPAFAQAAATVMRSMALISFERPNGLGNLEDPIPRPPRAVAEAPVYERDRLQRWWNMYYQQQQMFYTDQPVSAIIVDAQAGLLVTTRSNLHGGAEHGRVLSASGAGTPCAVIAVNKPLDLALIKAEAPLDGADPTFAPRPTVGDQIAVVGGLTVPGGLGRYAMTRGVVSAMARHLMQTNHAWIQIDARANYGSLGAAVIDDAGRIAGMTALLGPDGPQSQWLINSGITMVLDADAIVRALPQLTAGTGTDAQPRLGLGVSLKLTDSKVVIAAIIPDTGAAASDLKPGDVIAKIDGVAVASSQAMMRTLLKHKPGDHVAVEVMRGDDPKTIDVEITEFVAP